MLYCEKCGFHLSGDMSRCPFCQGSLSGERQEDAYPVLPAVRKPYWLLSRLMALLTVAVIVVCVAVNLIHPQSGGWSLFVAAGLGSIWLVTGVAVRKRNNPMKAVVWQLIVVSALVLLWDIYTGFGAWSIHFVLPVLFPCTQVAVLAIVQMLRLSPSDYLLYLIVCVLAGLIPLILLFCGALQVTYPSVICAAVSLILLAALILFNGTALKHEIVRRLHL